MPWVRIDEDFVNHPKIASAGPLAIALQVAALCYCNRNLTDGYVPRPVARTLLDWEIVRGEDVVWRVSVHSGFAGEDVDCEWVIDLLIETGIWERARGGYVIHDYHDFQPSKADVLTEREQKRAAGRKGGLASRKAKQAPAQASAIAGAQAGANHGAQPPAQAERQAESKPVPVPVEDLKPRAVTSPRPEDEPPLGLNGPGDLSIRQQIADSLAEAKAAGGRS